MLTSGRRAGATAIGLILVLAVVSGLLAGGVALPVVGVVGVAVRDAAQTFDTLKVPQLGTVPQRSEILDSRGHLIAYFYPDNIDRVPVNYDQISPDMRNAIVAIEDYRFYQHGAFDLHGTARAIVNDLAHQPIQGASTLAQQYVKNACILTAPNAKQKQVCYQDTLSRKLRELREAAIVEHEMTKRQLLAAYLSVAYFENGAYGIQVAAKRYFSTTAAHLNLDQSALLAGLVENPVAYDPLIYPHNAVTRRNTVLARMAQLHYITRQQAAAAEARPLGLNTHSTTLQSGCTAASAKTAAFFCDYVFAIMRKQKAFAKAESMLNTVGGLKIYTTLNPHDQITANQAVDYVMPPRGGAFNPNRNVDTEVLIQPGTGAIRAIAVDRPYGFGGDRTTVDYAVNTPYDGGAGVQTGSSSKIFTLLTALKQNVPFGFSMPYSSPAYIAPYFSCTGVESVYPNLSNAEGPGKGTATLYNGTTQSINVFFAKLEQKVGLCNVVKTAVSLGMTRADGKSLFDGIGKRDSYNYQPPADQLPGFTLGEVNVSPMDMADAYATVAARGTYCKPTAITRIATVAGQNLPIAPSDCHRVLSTAVADAASTILQGVLQTGTAAGRGIGIPAAGKTGTSDLGYYAAFAGYTPLLAGYVSVFNPISPTTPRGWMQGSNACYREVGGGQDCPGQMFGDNAPAATWQETFLNLHLPYASFVPVPPDSVYYSMGTGIASPKPPAPPKTGGGGGNGGGHGGGPGGGHGGNGGGNPPARGKH